MPPAAAAAAGVAIAAPIITSAIGNAQAAGDAGEARNQMALALQELDKVGLPPDLAKQLIYKEFQSAGIMSPEMEQDLVTGPSKVEQIQEDTSLRDAQMEALRGIRDRAKVGLTAEDRARLSQIRDAGAQAAESKRQQIIQNFAARGQGGAGAELASALSASQAAAQEQARSGDELAAQAAANSLRAIGEQANLATTARRQDFDVNQAKAAAADELNRFNIQNRLGVQQRNISAKNTAQQQNLSNAQNIMSANTDMYNQEKLRQANAQRQYWQDKLSQAQGVAGARQTQANYLEGQANQTRQQWNQIGAGISSGASAMVGGLGGLGGAAATATPKKV